MHEQVLAKREAGRFFNRVFTNGFQETQTRYLELPEDDPDAFDVFLKWLYGSYRTGNIEAFTELFRDCDGTQLIRYYILAHKYLIDGLQDHIISALYDMTGLLWCEVAISRNILEQFLASIPDSHLHRLLSRWFIYDTCITARDQPEVGIDNSVDELPEEFLRLVTKGMFKGETPDETDTFADFGGEKRDYLLRGD